MSFDGQPESRKGYSPKGKGKGQAPPPVAGKGDGKGKAMSYKEQVQLKNAVAASSPVPSKSNASVIYVAESVSATNAIRTDYPPANLTAEKVFGNPLAIRCAWDSFGGSNATYVLMQSKTGEEGSFEPICFGGGHAGEARYSNGYSAMRLAPDTQYYFQICPFEVGAAKPGPSQPTPPIVCKTGSETVAKEMPEQDGPDSLTALFDLYNLSKGQRRICQAIKQRQNMPDFFAELANEEIVWAVAVGAFGLSESTSDDDVRRLDMKVEERIRRLDQAESRFGWFSLRWTKPIMRRLLFQWFCGMLVIDPELQTREGSPIQFVREFYGDESGYPDPESQTEEWKKEGVDMYVLMSRSICRAYPMATTKGIVSFSDMQDFDWSKYDMGSKERNADIGALLPNKIVRMITFNPDEKMVSFYNDMSANVRNQYGFVQYDDFKSAVAGEGDFLPKELPTFVGGTYRVDIFKCLRFLFRREPEALGLLLEIHSEMEKSGELPRPKHMEL